MSLGNHKANFYNNFPTSSFLKNENLSEKHLRHQRVFEAVIGPNFLLPLHPLKADDDEMKESHAAEWNTNILYNEKNNQLDNDLSDNGQILPLPASNSQTLSKHLSSVVSMVSNPGYFNENSKSLRNERKFLNNQKLFHRKAKFKELNDPPWNHYRTMLSSIKRSNEFNFQKEDFDAPKDIASAKGNGRNIELQILPYHSARDRSSRFQLSTSGWGNILNANSDENPGSEFTSNRQENFESSNRKKSGRISSGLVEFQKRVIPTNRKITRREKFPSLISSYNSKKFGPLSRRASLQMNNGDVYKGMLESTAENKFPLNFRIPRKQTQKFIQNLEESRIYRGKDSNGFLRNKPILNKFKRNRKGYRERELQLNSLYKYPSELSRNNQKWNGLHNENKETNFYKIRSQYLPRYQRNSFRRIYTNDVKKRNPESVKRIFRRKSQLEAAKTLSEKERKFYLDKVMTNALKIAEQTKVRNSFLKI